MATKALPNGTTAKPEGKITVKKFTGEKPVRAGVGRGRTPSRFDEVVGMAKASGETYIIETNLPMPNGAKTNPRKDLIAELRKAADFHNTGMDIWHTEEGIIFETRAKRTRNAKPSTEEAQTVEVQA